MATTPHAPIRRRTQNTRTTPDSTRYRSYWNTVRFALRSSRMNEIEGENPLNRIRRLKRATLENHMRVDGDSWLKM